MAYYYCTCSTRKNKDKDVKEGRTPFREVPTDSEGVCLNCGHYAVAYFDRIDPNSGKYKLYDRIMDKVEVDEWKPKYVKGGLSLKTQKKLLNRRGVRDQIREGKNGNLDV